ncbi:hypothetical protein MKW98_026380 [Papaver atlanticum]|uniref:Uncharacterized protein n=1 Tax=Papaver atlanticum TaxID=357466 RepID=A0AAD4XH51_9MAGN|nr:hypothetical protein MKW98_026380 [Papaver atlanticum]
MKKLPKEQEFNIVVHQISQADYRLKRMAFQGQTHKESFDDGSNLTDNLPNSDAIRRGEYAVKRSLIRVLKG